MTQVNPIAIPINEEFVDPQGRLNNYFIEDPTLDGVIRHQRHVDIRAFTLGGILSPALLYYEGRPLSSFEDMTMAELDAGIGIIQTDEQWTNGTPGRHAGLGQHRGLQLACTAGANVASSVEYTALAYVNQSRSIDELYRTIDLATGFDDGDFISLALPNFPDASIDRNNSYLDLSSHSPSLSGVPPQPPTDAFNAPVFTSVASLKFADATITITSGNAEARWPRSAVTGIDLSKITGVRFRIQATGSCTFSCTGMRLLPSDWAYLPWDVNTKTEALERPAALDGNVTGAFDSDWPALFRSDSPSSVNDPRPIDAQLSLAFNSGSIATATDPNSITLYLRERSEDLLTPLDLDGIDTDDDGVLEFGFDQHGLDEGLEHSTPRRSQPDFGRAMSVGLPQSVLDARRQQEIDGDLQAYLERLPDGTAAAWIEAKLEWDGSGATLTVKDTETPVGEEYQLTGLPALDPNTDYLLDADLRNTTIRVRVIPIGPQGQLLDPLYDTGIIRDSSMFYRAAGRLGWTAFSNDADAVIYGIRTRATMFAAYESQTFESFTPVMGAELVASASPPRIIPVDISSTRQGGDIEFDTTKTQGGGSWRIKTRHSYEGLESSPFEIDDFRHSTARFDLWYPLSSVLNGGSLSAFLVSERGDYIELVMNAITPDTWQRIEIPLEQAGDVQTGRYSFNLVANGEITVTWWVENLAIEKQSIAWSGRSEPGDPWGISPGLWSDYGTLVNKPGSGIVFAQRGRFLQTRAEAQVQDAFIERISAKPKYAELGRLVWDKTEYPPPTAEFTYEVE